MKNLGKDGIFGEQDSTLGRAANVASYATSVGAGAGIVKAIANHEKNRPGNLQRFQRDRAIDGMNMLRDDPMKLGFTEGQQQQMVGMAAQNAQQQRQQQQQQIGQQALAGQGFQQGAFADASRKVAADAAQDMAQASAEVTSLNEQKIQQEKDRILGEVEALRQARQQKAEYWSQFGLNTAQTLGELAKLAGLAG